MMARTGLAMLVAMTSLFCVIAPASATVPTQVQYQGLLLDSGGLPLTSAVDLDFEIFDAITAGTSLWTESHSAVSVVDGVYSVALGSIVPLGSSILAPTNAFLEVTVDGETLTPRQQLLAVPFALVSETAENVGTIDSGFVEQLLLHQSFDGGAPDNFDPQEGLADVDGDGIANFVDSDNDNDGLSDVFEVGAGSDINLVTPAITGYSPSIAEGFDSSVVQVQGSGFQAGLSVVFGSQTPTPTNVTSTAFDVQVGPQLEGTVNVSVANPNGESALSTFDFVFFQPVIDSFSPNNIDEGLPGSITVTGQSFTPGMTVQFGAQAPTPTNLTPTSFDVSVAGTEPPGFVTVTVTLPNGNFTTNSTGLEINFGSPRVIFVTSTVQDGNLGGLAGADATCNSLASAAGLSGTFQAWLSDSTESPSTRESQAGDPYLLTNGLVVADDWADLTDGTLDLAISRDENDVFRNGFVWTNVAAVGAGSASPIHCTNWSEDVTGGMRGDASQTGSAWTHVGSGVSCGSDRRLYCVEQ